MVNPPDESSPSQHLAARRRRTRIRATAGVAVLVALSVAVALASLPLSSSAGAAPPVDRSTPALEEPHMTAVRIAAVGDITLGSDASRPEGGAEGLLAGARPFLTGDVVLGNLETTLAEGGAARCAAGRTSCYAFRAPPSFAPGLRRSGFTVLNLANNHANDYGLDGREATVLALQGAGLRTTGRPGEIATVRVGATTVAVVGFAPYPWAQDALHVAAARALVRRAAAGADLVVVTAHLSSEGSDHTHVRAGQETYLGERRGDSIAFARAVVDAGADLVALHGAHVLRALEWYRGRLIAYGLGNFSSHGNLSIAGPGGISVVLQLSLLPDGRWAGGRLAPLKLVGDGAPVADPSGAALDLVRALSEEDIGADAPLIAEDGELSPPATASRA
jgi:poly-gamma-glutamate capsule biosynthesis protein CapA/YwtB (metallophosphatase superfamily)